MGHPPATWSLPLGLSRSTARGKIARTIRLSGPSRSESRGGHAVTAVLTVRGMPGLAGALLVWKWLPMATRFVKAEHMSHALADARRHKLVGDDCLAEQRAGRINLGSGGDRGDLRFRGVIDRHDRIDTRVEAAGQASKAEGFILGRNEETAEAC